jgi:uncharacterized protein Yka (UPF0111/DUF47 family)
MNLLKVFDSNSPKFFEWFQELADNNVKAAKKLQSACQDIKVIKQSVKDISDTEHLSDNIVLKIFDELNSTFITPMDREDISDLTRSLDNVIDFIHLSIETISVYNVKKMNKTVIKFSELILQSTKVISASLPELSRRDNFSKINEAVKEINKLETEADVLLREGLEVIFKNPKNAIEVIRWRDNYNLMEEVTDKTEDIADVLHDLIIKYA